MLHFSFPSEFDVLADLNLFLGYRLECCKPLPMLQQIELMLFPTRVQDWCACQALSYASKCMLLFSWWLPL